MKKRAEWALMILVIGLLLLGVVVPLWLEYRAATGLGPNGERPRVPSLGPKDSFYCPLCGHDFSLEFLRFVPPRSDGRSTSLYVDTMGTTSWPLLQGGSLRRTKEEVHD